MAYLILYYTHNCNTFNVKFELVVFYTKVKYEVELLTEYTHFLTNGEKSFSYKVLDMEHTRLLLLMSWTIHDMPDIAQ